MHASIGHEDKSLSSLRLERVAIRDRGCILVLNSLVMRALARKARGPGSSPGPG